MTVLKLVCEFWVDAANTLWLVQMLSPVVCDGNSSIMITTGLPRDGNAESWQVSLRDSGGKARASTSLSSIRRKPNPRGVRPNSCLPPGPDYTPSMIPQGTYGSSWWYPYNYHIPAQFVDYTVVDAGNRRCHLWIT